MSRQPGTPRTIDPRYACYRLRVGRSPIHRFGVFAAEPIPGGRKVIEYTGEQISHRQALRRLRDPNRPKRLLIAALNRDWRIDAIRGGSGAEYINHCCDPNLRVRKTMGHILLYSRRRIRGGEELTMDYRLSPSAPRLPCRCGSRRCRGMLNRSPK
jgi:SET domain-containing protein